MSCAGNLQRINKAENAGKHAGDAKYLVQGQPHPSIWQGWVFTAASGWPTLPRRHPLFSLCCVLQEVSLQYHGTGPEHVLSCVPNEGIYITMTALLSPGDVVVAMYPGAVCNDQKNDWYQSMQSSYNELLGHFTRALKLDHSKLAGWLRML